MLLGFFANQRVVDSVKKSDIYRLPSLKTHTIISIYSFKYHNLLETICFV